MPYTKQAVGYQRRDTSLDAANLVKPEVLRSQIMYLFNQYSHLDTETISETLERPYRSVQPRVSELVRDGELTDSGVRTDGLFGRSIIVWRRPNANIG
tara:strand:- start:85 stop:378 length:294 start_codon:yes stop_codon:yes gene_type:complete